MPPKHPRRRVALAAAVLAAMLLAPAVQGQDAAPKKAPAKASSTKDKANLLTRDQLRACMDEQDRLQARRAEFEREQAELDRMQAQVKAMDADLQASIAAYDATDEAARQKLLDKGTARDQAADAFNARLGRTRELGQTYNAGRDAWAQRCSNKNFDELDEAAIRKERQQAARGAAKK